MTAPRRSGRPRRFAAAVRGAAFLASCALHAAAGADSATVEVQYRLAQRLAADRSPDAAQAFEKVVALAPEGPLADDALIGLARLQGVPDWPEDVWRLDAEHAAAASGSLSKLLESRAEADRAEEARYLLALVRLAPVPARDARRARRDLITVASAPGATRWGPRARYALGVLAEQEAATDRAAGAFARAIIDGAEGDLAGRARVGFARVSLRIGRFGDAAVWLQAAIDAGAPASLRADALRALAVRELLRERDPKQRWSGNAAPLASIATTRAASLLATAPDGGVLVYDRKNSALQLFDAQGSGGPPMTREGITALATDPYRRVYAAAGDVLLRLEGTALVVVAKLGSFREPAAIAVDAAGTAWIADRRGDRIGRLGVGIQEPVVMYDTKGAGVSALAVSGGRIFAAEEKAGRVVELPDSGPEQPFGPAIRRPIALAVDAAGRLSVLDGKSDTVIRLAPSGEVRDTLVLGVAGVSRAIAIAAADDGAIRVLDGSTGLVAVAP